MEFNRIIGAAKSSPLEINQFEVSINYHIAKFTMQSHDNAIKISLMNSQISNSSTGIIKGKYYSEEEKDKGTFATVYEVIYSWKNQKKTLKYQFVYIVACCSVAQSCPTLCNPMDCNIPGYSVLHYVLEFAQIQEHWVGDPIQTPHLLPTPHLPSIFPTIRVISNESTLCVRWPSTGASASPSVFPMNIQDWFPLDWLVWFPSCPRDSQESSPTPQFKSINFSVLRLLYDPTLISVHDYWKNHNFDYMDLCQWSYDPAS